MIKNSSNRQRAVPFFDYPSLFSGVEQDVLRTIRDVLARGAYIMQEELAEFEEQLAAYVGVKHAVGVADGTMALLLSLMAMPLKRGDEVVLPAHTFVASAAAVHHCGGVPVLVDCGRDHLVDPEAIRAAITPRTRGIMPVQLNGRIAEMDAIIRIAEEYGLFVVEDACQALGAKYRGQHAGTFGAAAALSFYPSKTLGCFGDGGAVLTDDDEVAAKIRLLRDHGRGGDGDVTVWGFNARLDNLQAAVLSLKLTSYEECIGRRREIARIYQNRLADLEALHLPPPPSQREHFDIYQNYEIEADRRNELRQYLSEHGIGTILQWGGKTINRFKSLGFDVRLPYTDQMVTRFLLLPMNTALSNSDVDYVCDCVAAFYQT